MVICHELSHMWFGNLVTMDWWNGLWLNESFADFSGYFCMSQIHSKMDFEVVDAWVAFLRRADRGYEAD